MKTFARHRTSQEIIAACKEANFTCDTTALDSGSDFIRFKGQFGGELVRVAYNVCNGRFYGALIDEAADADVTFSSSDDKYDGQPWYDAILNFVYVPQTDPVDEAEG